MFPVIAVSGEQSTKLDEVCGEDLYIHTGL